MWVVSMLARLCRQIVPTSNVLTFLSVNADMSARISAYRATPAQQSCQVGQQGYPGWVCGVLDFLAPYRPIIVIVVPYFAITSAILGIIIAGWNIIDKLRNPSVVDVLDAYRAYEQEILAEHARQAGRLDEAEDRLVQALRTYRRLQNGIGKRRVEEALREVGEEKEARRRANVALPPVSQVPEEQSNE